MKKKSPSTQLHNAFSMIELIFVIVILGIVASIGSEVVAKTYESYINQRALHKASLKTELAATQIANRLARAVPGTIVRRVSTTSTATPITYTGHDDDTILQWVGADIDSFDEGGWSGFCDLSASSETGKTLYTPGSKLGLTRIIITKLKGTIKNNARIYFHTKAGLKSLLITDNSLGGTNITMDENLSTLSEHYKLAWSSYALSVEDANTSNGNAGNLVLYYTFSPKIGIEIPTTAKKSILLKNVTTFEFRGDGNTVRFKLCVREAPRGIALDPIVICKEKAVF